MGANIQRKFWGGCPLSFGGDGAWWSRSMFQVTVTLFVCEARTRRPLSMSSFTVVIRSFKSDPRSFRRIYSFRSSDVRFYFLQVPFQFRATVLEPRDHLGIGETQTQSDVISISRCQVFLVEKSLLQFVNLLVGESRARFPSFLGGLRLWKQVELFSPGRFCKRR